MDFKINICTAVTTLLVIKISLEMFLFVSLGNNRKAYREGRISNRFKKGEVYIYCALFTLLIMFITLTLLKPPNIVPINYEMEYEIFHNIAINKTIILSVCVSILLVGLKSKRLRHKTPQDELGELEKLRLKCFGLFLLFNTVTAPVHLINIFIGYLQIYIYGYGIYFIFY